MVLHTPPHRLSSHAPATANANANLQTAATSASAHRATTSAHCATPSANSATRDDVLPLRLQCRVFELGKRMASWQESLLLPDNPERMSTRPSTRSNWNNFLAI